MTRAHFCAAIISALSATSYAQTGTPPGEPAGISFGGGMFLKPVLDATYLYDSNLYRQSDDETSAQASVISPGVALEYLSSNNVVRLGYRGDYAFYDTSSADDYADSDFFFESRINEGGRHRLAISLMRDEGHDPFGTERTEGSVLQGRDVDEWTATSGKLAYTIGAPSATFNLTLWGDGMAREYDNNREDNGGLLGTKYLDRKIMGGGAEAKVRISPRTGLLIDVQHHDIEYDLKSPTATSKRDGSEFLARAGFQWFASAKTLGRVRVGLVKRDFDAKDREDFSGLNWELAVSYRPVTYSEIVIDTSRSALESYFDQADFIDVTRFGLKWTHGWTPRFETGVSLTLAQYSFEGVNRDDDLVLYGLYGQYDLLRSVKMRVGVDGNSRDSSQTNLDFDRFMPYVRLQFAL